MTAREPDAKSKATEPPALPSRFVLCRPLGVGSFGSVWDVYDKQRGHNVALKILHQIDPVVLYRFKHEFRTFADIIHPNLIGLHEMFCFQDRWFFTMDLVDGENFLRYVRTVALEANSSSDQPATNIDAVTPTGQITLPPLVHADHSFDETRLRTALFGLANGVFALHNAGKVHRDLKPSNVLVTQDGHVVILDFGMTRELEDQDPQITVKRQILGTPAYMSPEQAAGNDLSPASDWYSVGIMLFEALTLARPHRGTTRTLFIKKQTVDAPDPRTLVADIPPDLALLTIDLLRREPQLRPSGQEILQRLDEKSVIALSPKTKHTRPTKAFFGRASELSFLQNCLERVSATQTVLVRIHGPSGTGKSALVTRFLTGLKSKTPQCIILRARCHEQESVPLKALDGLVDSLTRYLTTLDPDEVKRLVPPDFPVLLRVFPVLARVPSFGSSTRLPSLELDLDEARVRAFDALKQMLSILSRKRILVVHVDDLQWADLESSKALQELVMPPFPVVALVLETYRTERLAPHEALEVLIAQHSSPGLLVEDLSVEPLSHEESRAFALSLMNTSSDDALHFATTIADESLGNPFFVRELVRQYHHNAEPEARESLPPEIRLDQAIVSRLSSLDSNDARLLNTIALSERPLTIACAGKASQVGSNLRESLSRLRGQRLILTRGQRDQDPVVVSHERIRQAVLANLSAEQLKESYRTLAEVLRSETVADPEALAYAYRGAGDQEQAHANATIAANRAYEARAYERAVTLYRMAVDCASDATDSLSKEQLGDALAAMGRRPEAATFYFDAIRNAAPARALRLQQKAASHLLKAGHFDEGIENATKALAQLREAIPASRRYLSGLLWYRRTRLSLRGFGTNLKDRGEVDEARMASSDFFAALAAGLSQIDPTLGFYLHTQGLLEALRAGEASRIIRALLTEACFLASQDHAHAEAITAAFNLASEIAKKTDQYNSTLLQLPAAVIAFQSGKFRKALVHAERAERDLSQEKGETWELVLSRNYVARSLAHLGRYRELIRRVKSRLQNAFDRGDFFSATTLSTGICNLCWLVQDDVEGARAVAERSMAQWSQAGFHLQHFAYFLGNAHVDLYVGEPLRALDRLRGISKKLEDAGLMNLRQIRTEHAYLRARVCLAVAAAHANQREDNLAQACKDWGVLRREYGGYANACALQIEATIRKFGSDPKKVFEALEKAIQAFVSQNMLAHANALRFKRAMFLGETDGHAETERATNWMKHQGVQRPELLSQVWASGI